MKVYILTAEYCDDKYVEGVFSSYSAMITHLKNAYGYESKVTFSTDGSGGKFKDTCELGYGVVVWSLSYEVHDLIGEHCPRTDCLKLDQEVI